MSIALVPFYIRLMGIESYALVGLYLVLQNLAAVLDVGLSPTVNRELARLSTLADGPPQSRDLVRTLEIAYWPLGVLIGGCIILASPFIAMHWIRAETLGTSTVEWALVEMGLLATVQWPISLYQGGLMGLGRQTQVNAISVVMATIRGVGSLAVLTFVSPSILAFFAWQICISTLHVGWLALSLWHALPRGVIRPRFSRKVVASVWRFAAGVTGISGLGVLLTQLDKVILSGLLSLETFGYYVLATTVTSVLYLAITPVFTTAFPHFSALIASGQTDKLARLYHLSCQILSATLFPAAAFLAVFSHDVLKVWTDNVTAANTAPIVTLLVIGTALNGLMHMPYALQLAAGWTRVGLYIGVLFVVLLVPAIYLLATRYGAIGGASAWLLLNLIYVAIGVPATHSRLLRGAERAWLVSDIAPPLIASAVIVVLGKALIPADLPPLGLVVALGTLLFVGVGSSAIAAPMLRERLIAYSKRTFGIPRPIPR